MSQDLRFTNYLAAFEPVVRENLERVAIVDAARQTTYGALWSMVQARADELRRAGIRVGDRVGLIAENSTEFIATALAVWAARAALITIYPSAGTADMRHSIESTDPALLVVQEGVDLSAVPLEEMGLPVASLLDFEISSLRDATPTRADIVDELALICLSSGTTSRPKAIMVSHLAIYNCAETYAEVWHLSRDDRTVVALPMAWMYGLASTTLAALLRGGTVIALRRSRPELVASAIETHGGTVLPSVTATFAKLADLGQSEPRRPWSASLRLCISGGEPRNEAAFDRFRDVTGLEVFDAYCASECLPLVTYDPTEDAVPVTGSAGKLVPRALLKVLDEAGKPVATGEVGEAFTSGPGIMLGYWGDEELTDASLTPDGWYRTKDLVRVDADGYVYVVGRLSDLIIRAGTNVSPAEVESVLRMHPDVADAGVVGMPDDTYGQMVAAAVVLKPGAALNESKIIEFARRHLSSFKVPSLVRVLETLPVNQTTGKVDRKAIGPQLAVPRHPQEEDLERESR